MPLRERLRNPFVQQYLLEILLPLIGYFFFDWTLLIIAAFYLIDQIASEVSFMRKLRAIRKAENKPAGVLIVTSLILFLVLVVFELFLLRDFFIKPIDAGYDQLASELTAFAKEELWLLFPLVIFMYYLKDQFTFFIPRRYLQKMSTPFFKWHWIENCAILTLIYLGGLVVKNVYIHDVVMIAVFLTLKLTFDFTLVRLSERRSTRF